MKTLKFVGSSLEDLRDFPSEARHEAGVELMRVQMGFMPTHFKPVQTVGTGVYEIRIHIGGAWRVIYVAKFESAIYVLHAFQKKTQKTDKSDIYIATRRYQIIAENEK